MASIIDLIMSLPSAQDRMMTLLSLTGGGGGSYDTSAPGAGPPVTTPAGPTEEVPVAPGVLKAEGLSPDTVIQRSAPVGTTVQPGQTQYRYTQYDKPFMGVPENMVTRQGITLQRGPMRSLMDIARESNLLPGKQEIGMIGQGYRSVDAQRAAYASKPGLAAPPGYSYHGQGLAMDAQWWSDRLADELRAAGWTLPMSYEPWHWSYGVSG